MMFLSYSQLATEKPLLCLSIFRSIAAISRLQKRKLKFNYIPSIQMCNATQTRLSYWHIEGFIVPDHISHTVPDSNILMAFALASSRAVTHLCRSISLLALKWNTWLGPLVITKLHESIVSMKAPAKLTVPLHVCAISSCVLQDSISRLLQ